MGCAPSARSRFERLHHFLSIDAMPFAVVFGAFVLAEGREEGRPGAQADTWAD